MFTGTCDTCGFQQGFSILHAGTRMQCPACHKGWIHVAKEEDHEDWQTSTPELPPHVPLAPPRYVELEASTPTTTASSAATDITTSGPRPWLPVAPVNNATAIPRREQPRTNSTPLPTAPTRLRNDHGPYPDVAGRVERLLARLLDGVFCVGGLMLGFGAAVVLLPSRPRFGDINWERPTETNWVALLPYIGYTAAFLIEILLLAWRGQSVGKWVLGLRIVRLADQRPVGFVRGFLLREVPIILMNFVPVIIGLIDVLLIFREDRRCLHDHIAGTEVRYAPRR